MLTVTDRGLYCAAGDFHIDPWRSVERAVITHAHSDHARPGSRMYLAADCGVPLLRCRLGGKASIRGLPYGEAVDLNGVSVSFHPAGHILGSAQIRMEHRGQVWVVSGDYKLQEDPTCSPFEPVRCHVFVTECTFGLPVYRWPDPRGVFQEVNAWWLRNQRARRTSLLLAYSLGKAQRMLVGVDPTLGPLFAHDAIHSFLPAYAAAGVRLPSVERATDEAVAAARGLGLVVVPPSAFGTAWPKGWGEVSVAFASGWMLLRNTRRRRGVDRGFVVSDHADWPGLLQAIQATGAGRVWVTHGAASPLVRWLQEKGWEAEALSTRFGGDADTSSKEDGAGGGAERED